MQLGKTGNDRVFVCVHVSELRHSVLLRENGAHRGEKGAKDKH